MRFRIITTNWAFSYPGPIGLHLFAHQAVDLNGRSRSELFLPLLRIDSEMRTSPESPVRVDGCYVTTVDLWTSGESP